MEVPAGREPSERACAFTIQGGEAPHFSAFVLDSFPRTRPQSSVHVDESKFLVQDANLSSEDQDGELRACTKKERRRRIGETCESETPIWDGSRRSVR